MNPQYRTVRVGDLDIHYDLADYTVAVARAAAGDFSAVSRVRAQHAFWRPWVPLLATDYRVLWFDARGCGETTKPAPGSRMSFSPACRRRHRVDGQARHSQGAFRG
jgi:hypothetical protein